MEFTDAVKVGFKNYFVFSGKASRPAYWWWTLLVFLVFSVSWVFENSFGVVNLTVIAILALAFPSIAVSVRRLRDAGISGFWLLFWLLPWSSFFVFFIINVPLVLSLNLTSLDPDMSDEEVMAFVTEHPELAVMVFQSLVVLGLFFCMFVVQAILASQPSKNTSQTAVAPITY